MTPQMISEINALPAEAQRQLADFAEFLRQKYRNAPTSQPTKANEIDKEPFIGMWSDREDVADSSRAMRELRKSEWGEKS